MSVRASVPPHLHSIVQFYVAGTTAGLSNDVQGLQTTCKRGRWQVAPSQFVLVGEPHVPEPWRRQSRLHDRPVPARMLEQPSAAALPAVVGTP